MTQLSKVTQNIHQHKDKSCNLKKHKKSNSRPNRAVWTVFVNCAHWRGSTLAIYKTVLIIFPLNLQTITITLDGVKWRWGGQQCRAAMQQNSHEHAKSHLVACQFDLWRASQALHSAWLPVSRVFWPFAMKSLYSLGIKVVLHDAG